MIFTCRTQSISFKITVLLVLLVIPFSTVKAQQTQEERGSEYAGEAFKGVTVRQLGRSLILTPDVRAATGQVAIPRFCARLREIIPSHIGAGSIVVHPEPHHWEVRWKDIPNGPKTITLTFDEVPTLLPALPPIEANGDGSLILHACFATTAGAKLRYEPQPHKNTVGYWVNPDDTATWTIQIDSSGEFNVGILQGCGSGQGGSIATVRLLTEEKELSKFDFEVEETGHFQNFHWRQIGQLSVLDAGVYQLQIKPKKIADKALMDVRAIHLIQRPVSSK